MGHSLYGRFVKDEEGLNELIKKHLSQSKINLRALVLDPGIENQQMCEVFEAQLGTPEEKGRAILPLYDDKGKIKVQDEKGNPLEGKGDIVESLNALEAWGREIVGNASLEVRTTSRLMYMSIARFGNSIIITPYRKKGLFKESVALVFKEEAPLYDAYREVFDDIWKSCFETTIKLYKYPRHDQSNPVKHFLPKQQTRREKPNLLSFDYERFLLEKHIERIKAVFDNLESTEKKPIPPFEIEIQPSEECTLHCVHCIGKHLSQRRGNPTMLKNDLSSLLDYQVGGWKVERFRISGLLGDPLSDSIRHVTLDFLKKAKEVGREVIILTNGAALKEESVQREILQADYIHVSLDAASRKTFFNLKGEDCFDIIKESITELCNNIRLKKSLLTKLGLGFVVTQGNAHEVTDAIDLAKEVGSHFIRFKPDIRGMHAISWRTWKEAEAKIEQYQLKEKSLDIIMTDAGWPHYRMPVVDRCWAQYFYTTVGSDNSVYPCDHLTANGRETALGSLGIFRDIWENYSANDKLGRRQRQCILCPPFGWRLNRLVEQLHVLYKENKNNWDTVKKWVDKALKSV